MIKMGAAAVHIEDQVQAKRCGHRPNKAVVSQQEMVDRVKAAVDAKTDPNFVIMHVLMHLPLRVCNQQLTVPALVLRLVLI